VDEIVVALPEGRQWHGVAHLVLAGIAARLDLTVEMLEDWQLALAEVLERQRQCDELRVVFRASPEQLEAEVGPVCKEFALELEREDEGVGLRRVLATLIDNVVLEMRDDERWIVLRKATASTLDGAD